MPEQIERKLVEDYLIDELQIRGWKFVPAKDLERESITEPLLVESFKRALKELNTDTGISEEEINEILLEIQLLPSSFEGIKRFLRFLKYG